MHEKAAPNTLATIFGEVHYHRTYYKHKTEKDCRYLSDELVGIDAYDKMDVSLKAKLIEEAIDTPYARSGRKAAETIEISSQSVMNAIRELGPISSSEVKISRAKETPKILYIEWHISHIYSDRLSSRPLGWSREGVDQMARLRVFAANGGNLFDLSLRKKQERIRETRTIELDLKVCRKKMQKASGETIDNLPALNSGKRTQLALALRGIRGI